MNKNNCFQILIATTVTTAAIVAIAPSADASFTDVKPYTEAAKAIDKLVKQNIIGGYPDGTFKPTKGVTRGEFAKIITLLNVEEEDIKRGSTTFKDVSRTHWAQKYVHYAVKEKLLSGDKDGKFGVDAPLTRGQFAKIMVTQLDAKIPNITLPFTDVKTGAWYEDGVKLLLERNITTGTSQTTFSPDTPITREQLAIFLDRAGLLGEDEIDEIGPIPELVPFLNSPSYQGHNVFEQFKKVVKDKGIISQASDLTNLMPTINLETNKIENIQEGEFTYNVTSKAEPDRPGYVLLVKYNQSGVESFKVYTRDQFAQKVKKAIKGPEQLAKAVKEKHGYNETPVIPMFYQGTVFLNERKDVYYNFFKGKPVIATNGDQGYFDNARYAYLLTPKPVGDLYDFTVKEILPVTFKLPSNMTQYALNLTSFGSSFQPAEDAVMLRKVNAEDYTIDVYPFAISYREHIEFPINSVIQLQYMVQGSNNIYVMEYVYHGNNKYTAR